MLPESVLFASTFVLVVEFVVLGLLAFGYTLKRKKKYREHGITMTSAVVLHLVTIFTWMVQSIIIYFSVVAIEIGDILQLTIVLHVALGTIAAALGVWLVTSWHLQTDTQKCFARKRIMLTTITLWSVAILLGIVLYIALVVG
jgi:uncharacterized membrane protein YozB (DUF420 family)